MNQHPLFLIVDLFCGFGGTTTGFADAMGKRFNEVLKVA
jgi:site-specific DNA-cytosine methylase